MTLSGKRRKTYTWTQVRRLHLSAKTVFDGMLAVAVRERFRQGLRIWDQLRTLLRSVSVSETQYTAPQIHADLGACFARDCCFLWASDWLCASFDVSRYAFPQTPVDERVERIPVDEEPTPDLQG